MPLDLILGTAGHIDHGKTSLVKALTGVDTDRLPEEKRRGITIDLGFAELDLGEYRLGIVDVPGHERFVRNMLAGATGIDMALLVVAADDSVKPQTREHLEILKLLDLRVGVIALTKCDLPEPDWVDLVEEDVRQLVAGTSLAQAEIIRTAAPRGMGIDELRAALARAARYVGSLAVAAADTPFRMAIDRTFTLAGHGTVVTGSVTSGQVRVGDELRIEPSHQSVRIRGLQNHDRPAEEVHRGQRAAINLVGVHHDEIARGQELSSPGHLVPSRVMTVRLELLASAPRPLKHRGLVRLHLGTAEVMASVSLLDRDELLQGEAASAQLFLSEPAVATWNQAFVLRSESPVATLGGGRVLDSVAPKLRRHDVVALERITELSSPDDAARAAAACYFFGIREWESRELSRAAGITDVESTVSELLARGCLQEVVVSPTRTWRVERTALEQLSQRIESLLRRLHEQAPLRTSFETSRVTSRLAYFGGEAFLLSLLERMQQQGRVVLRQREIALAGHGPQLSNNERELLSWLVEQFASAGFQPPAVDELRTQVTRNHAAIGSLMAVAVAAGQLVEFAPGMYLHADAERGLRETLSAAMSSGSGLTVSQIRELLGTTRKYAVPLCEYLDRVGFTRRSGDLRVLA